MAVKYRQTTRTETQSSYETSTYSTTDVQYVSESELKEIEWKKREEKREKKVHEIKQALSSKTLIYASGLNFENYFYSYKGERIFYHTRDKKSVHIDRWMLEMYLKKAEELQFHEGLCKVDLVQLSYEKQKMTLLTKVKLMLLLRSIEIKKLKFSFTISLKYKDAYEIYQQNSSIVDHMIYGYCRQKNINVVSLVTSKGSLEIALILLQLPTAMLDLIELTRKLRSIILKLKK